MQVRWPRRIAGVLATAALFGVALAMVLMILPSSEPDTEVAVPPVPAAKGDGAARKPAAKGRERKLTAGQRRARTAAVAAVRAQGYEPVRASDFDPRRTLRVLVGYRSGDPTGPRRAFFFRGSTLLGTDSPAPSSGLKVSSAGSSWVTLSYGVYAAGDRACCPSSGRVKVRFGLSDGAVAPTGGTIPASTQRVATG